MSDGTLPGNNEKAPKLRVSVPSQNSSSGSSSSNVNNEEEKGRMAGLKKRIFRLPDSLKWIPANWTWSKIKAALRCAIVAWVSGVVFVIPAVEIFLGVASFLLLLSSVLSPPSDPFISVLERELLILLFVTVSWAWSCLGIKLADLARNFHDPTVTIQAAATGRYVEGGSSVVLAVFLFIGTATVLYIKARMGPGPYLFATIFACICLDICLTTSALYPFPFYRIGRTIVLPLSIHSALALLGSIFIFPSSMSTEYTTRLQGVLGPLQTFITLNHTLLSNDPTPSSLEFEDMVKQIAGQAGKSEGALVPLAASSRLLSNDLVYGRFGPDDFRVFHGLVRRITGRANGMRGYFDLVALSRDRLALGSPPNSPVTSRVQTPSVSRVHTPAVSRRPSIDAIVERGRTQAMTELHQVKSEPSTDAHFQSGQVSSSSLRSGSHSHQRHALPRHVHHHHHHHHALHHSLMHLTLSRQSLTEQAVGMFESQRYMDLENLKFGEPKAGVYTERAMQLLGKSSAGLLKACEGGVGAVKTWLGNVGGARGVGWWDRKRRGAGDAVNARKMREE